MRSFVSSALVIALVLVGQQWVVKSSEAQSLKWVAPAITTLNSAAR
jgi:hypothetical protein